ncbi:MAG: YihY/virulence factor BrkB family protein [Acidimicrobiia bacterium]|nr:YihY/virulence factor BrkB family protein [Acidimicrobiia bacterium]
MSASRDEEQGGRGRFSFRRVGDLWQATVSRLESSGRRLRRAVPALDLAWEVGVRFQDHKGTVLAGHLAYRFFVFAAPLMLVLAAILGYVATENIDLIRYAREIGVSTDTATDTARQAGRGIMTALVIGIPALLLATRGVIRGMRYTYAEIWQVELDRSGLLRQMGLVVAATFGFYTVNAVIAAVERQGPLFAALGWTGSLALTAVALLAVLWGMPRRSTRIRDLLPGSGLGAVAVSGVQLFVAVYLPARIAGASAVYGTFAAALAILFYMFLLAFVFVGIGIVSVVWFDRATVLAGRPWIVDPEALPRWLRRPVRWAAQKQPHMREAAEGEPGNGEPHDLTSQHR